MQSAARLRWKGCLLRDETLLYLSVTEVPFWQYRQQLAVYGRTPVYMLGLLAAGANFHSDHHVVERLYVFQTGPRDQFSSQVNCIQSTIALTLVDSGSLIDETSGPRGFRWEDINWMLKHFTETRFLSMQLLLFCTRSSMSDHTFLAG